MAQKLCFSIGAIRHYRLCFRIGAICHFMNYILGKYSTLSKELEFLVKEGRSKELKKVVISY